MVNFVAGHISIVPCTLAHCADARQDPWRHFGRNTYFPAVVKDPHHIAICNTTLLGIDGVDPHFLTTGRLQNIDIAVAGVRTGFVMKAKQLQRKCAAFGIVPPFKRGGVYGKWANYFILLQLPCVGNFRQPAGVNFNLSRRCFERIGLRIVAEFFISDKMPVRIFAFIDPHFFSSS